jgi:hypothetical protein
MPHRMVVRGVEWSPYFELRDYGAARVCLDERGIKPVLRDGGRLLFAFESLAAREKAWREGGADPGSAELREIAIFKTISRKEDQTASS